MRYTGSPMLSTIAGRRGSFQLQPDKVRPFPDLPFRDRYVVHDVV